MLFFSLLANTKAFAEENESIKSIIENNFANDSTVILDSNALDSSTVALDSNEIEAEKIKIAKKIHQLNRRLGSLLIANDTISFHKIPQINYCTLNEILPQIQPTIPLFTGILGNSNAFSTYGATPNENGLLMNNVSLFNLYGSENFNILSPEFSAQMEILTGSKSAILAGKSGTVVNIQTPIFNVGKPYARLWFTQGDNKLIGVDGTFSQNFLPNWNLTTGFRRLSANSYYQNSFFDSWNARIMLRNNLSDRSAISLLYHFSNYHTGDFGGIFFADYGNSLNLVRSNFSNLSNRQYRSDIILSHSALTADSTLTVNSNLFFNHNENNILFRNEIELLKIDSAGRNLSNTINYGINTNLRYNLFDRISLNFGGELFYIKIPNSAITKEFSGFGSKIFGLASTEISSFDLSFGGRFANKYSHNLIGFGGNLAKNFSNRNSDTKNNSTSKMYLDISHNDSEPIPVLDYNFERHLLGLLGFQFEKNKFLLDVNLFYRMINNSLLLDFRHDNLYSFSPEFSQIDSHNIFGLSGKVILNFRDDFDFSFTVQNFFDNQNKNSQNKFKPKFYFTSKVQYTYVRATSQVSGGLSASFLVNAQQMYYNPIFKSYTTSDLENSFASDGLTLFLSAKFGNAFVRASLKNILGTNFSYLAYYPILSQELCLSLTWAFPNSK